MDSDELVLFFLLPIAVMVTGVIVVLAGLRHRAKMLELVHRERVAMIERGIMPPEMNPILAESHRMRDNGAVRGRSFSVGIIVVGFGLGVDDHHRRCRRRRDHGDVASAAPSRSSVAHRHRSQCAPPRRRRHPRPRSAVLPRCPRPDGPGRLGSSSPGHAVEPDVPNPQYLWVVHDPWIVKTA